MPFPLFVPLLLFVFPLQPEIHSVNKAKIMTRKGPKSFLRRTEKAAGKRRSGAHSTAKKVVGAVSVKTAVI